MGRPRTTDRAKVRGLMLTLRLAEPERDALDALVAARAEALAAEGGAVTAASVVRWLIVREARKLGLVEPRASRKIGAKSSRRGAK
mgnify:CR=1 FL=1